MGKLRTIYPNLLKLSYDNLRTQSTGDILGAERPEEKTPLALFQDLYQLQNNQPLTAEQAAEALPLLLAAEVVVSREIGSGVVPIDAGERAWRERHGRLLRQLAEEG